MNPLVSVCMPCFNAERYVKIAIDSILEQSWDSLEIIIVNDGSTDASELILDSIADSRVRVIHQENRGQCAAANRALAEAQGTLIKFFDADDILSVDSIKSQVNKLGSRQDAIASSRWGRFYSDDISTFSLNEQSVWRDMPSIDWLVEAWADAQPMMQCGLWLIPRAVIDKAGGWDESLSLINDFEFFSRLLCHVRDVLFTPEATLFYRSGIKGSLSSLTSRIGAESAFNSILKGTSHLLERRSDPLARLSCANIMRGFEYTFYPHYPDLLTRMNLKIDELGGSDLSPPGGPWFQRARRLIGWKAARRLQLVKGRF